MLARLTAEERARLQAEEERQAREAAAAAERARAEREQAERERAEEERQSTPAAAPPASGGTSTSRGLVALAYARAQIGKAYVYGGVGPEVFDCSGLTGSAWRAAGVSLPRTSQQQFRAGRPVALEDLAPGDLVFYYSDISHVGLYAGGGQILHASRPGKPIGYDAIGLMPIAGARTVG